MAAGFLFYHRTPWVVKGISRAGQHAQRSVVHGWKLCIQMDELG